MGNNTHQHPLNKLPKDKPINLKKYIPEKEWWTVWYYICTGKHVAVAKE